MQYYIDMVSHSAQGAAQALEDGAALGELFARIQDKKQLEDVLRMYESIRKPRTTCVVRRSDLRRNIYQLPDGHAQEQRDRQLMQETPFDGYPTCIDDPQFQSWLLSYDIKLEVEKAWEEYEQSELSDRNEIAKGITKDVKDQHV